MIYSFKNSETDETIDISMSMKDYAHYKGESGKEECWERIYDVPQISMSNTSCKKVNPWDVNSYVNRTNEIKGSYGDLQDMSQEMSDIRATQSDTGEDPLKRKHFDKYEKNNGKKHIADKPKTIESSIAKVEF